MEEFEEIQGELADLDLDSLKEEITNAECCVTAIDLVANLQGALDELQGLTNSITALLKAAKDLKVKEARIDAALRRL